MRNAFIGCVVLASAVAVLQISPRLGSLYPNPFSGRLSINYEAPLTGAVALNVYDLSGRMVRRLAQGIAQSGQQSVTFDGRDGASRVLPAGVYFVRLETENQLLAEKVVLSR